MRELVSSSTSEVALRAPLPPPPVPAAPQPPKQQTQQQEEAAAPAERVHPPVWYTVAVCTSEEEGAGLVPADGSAKVFLVLHGARGSSQRVQLPAQAGDFERGQEDVFRCEAVLAKQCLVQCARVVHKWCKRVEVGRCVSNRVYSTSSVRRPMTLPCAAAGCSCPAWARWRS